MALIANPAHPIQPSHTFLVENVPNELWPIVLRHLAADPNMRHITAMAFVSKGFLSLCLSSFRMQVAFGGTIFIEKSSLEKLRIESCPIIGAHGGNQRLLTVDEQGRHYSCSQWLDHGHILSIMDPTTMKMTTLNLQKAFPEEIDRDYQEQEGIFPFWQGQRIVNCHPLQKGFIVVTVAGCSVWEWDSQGEPLFSRFTSPFEVYKGSDTEITFSALHESKLLIQQKYSQSLQVLDLEDPVSKFSEVTVSETIKSSVKAIKGSLTFTYLCQIEGKPCLMYDDSSRHSSHDTAYSLTVQLTQDQTGYVLEGAAEPIKIDGELIFDLLPRGSPHWTLFFQPQYGANKHKSCLCVVQNGVLWMGPEFGLRMPRAENEEHYFIYNDYLFLSYQDGTFRLIHLLTKQDYFFNSQVLQHYLTQKKAILYWLSIEQITSGYPTLKLIVQNDNTLHQLEIPFDPENKSIEEPDLQDPQIIDLDEMEGPPVEQPAEKAKQPPPQQRPRSIKKIEKDSPSCCSNKITFWVGIALLILAGAATATLIVLHPGTVVYEGNGVILSLPAVLVLSLGGSAALLTIAIGSYLWWKGRSTAS